MARKDVDAIVSGAGWIGGFAEKISLALRKRGASIEDIHRLVTDAAEVPVGKIADALIEFMGVGNAQDFWRAMEDVAIQIPALEQPTLKEIQERFSWVRSIERDTSPTEAVTLRLGPVLSPNEDYVSGSEYERRLASRQSFVLGYQQAVWLVDHQDEYPGLKALLGKVYIDFPGLVVVGAVGSRKVPYLYQGVGRWYLDWGWLGFGFGRRGRVASK